MGERPTLKAMYETAEAVREMRAAIDAHLRDAMSAEELADFGYRSKARVRGNAHAVGCAVDLGEYRPESGTRREDVVHYARELAMGLSLDVEEAGALHLSTARIAERAGTPVVRRASNGLGVIDTTFFASPATGRTFSVWSTISPMIPSPAHDWAHLCVPRGDRTLGLIDVIETMFWDVIEEAESTFEMDIDVLPVVALMREDDNGNCVEIRTFRSYTGAMREAQRFEALGHKQRYWVDVKREPRW